MCFLKEGKSDQAARCIRSRIMTKVIDSVLSIDKFEKNVSCLKVCCNHSDWNITYKPWVVTCPQATMLYMNTNVLKRSKNYTNKLVSVKTSNNSKIFLRLIWFLPLKDSPTMVLYTPGNEHQSINKVLENKCVCLLTF